MDATPRARLVTARSMLAAALLVAAAPLPAQAPPLRVEPYTVRSYDGRSEQAELGTLTVPESRGRPGAATVTLAFLRLKSTSSTPASPIVFLMGGPGIPATVMAPIPPYFELFERLRATADVILVDQRGNGRSSPSLDCPAPLSPPDADLLTSRAALVEAYRRAYVACAAYWRGRGVEPRDFGLDASADDLDDLRRALGAERLSLLAFSYGTRLALDYARRHPSRLDHMVLQGPETPDLRYRSPAQLDALFGRLADFAAADSASAPFSTDLRGRLAALLAALARVPDTVRVRSPGGDSVNLAVGPEGLAAIVAEHEADPRLPALVATLERGDTRLLAQRAAAIYAGVASGGGSLMGRAAECSTPASDARVAAVAHEAAGSLLGVPYDDGVVIRAFCSSLGMAGRPWRDAGPGPRAFRGPALVIVGDLDTQTPMSNAAVVARALPGSATLVVANGKHELLTQSVVQDAVADFFAGHDASGRRLRVDPPRFLSIQEALQPPRRPGS